MTNQNLSTKALQAIERGVRGLEKKEAGLGSVYKSMIEGSSWVYGLPEEAQEKLAYQTEGFMHFGGVEVAKRFLELLGDHVIYNNWQIDSAANTFRKNEDSAKPFLDVIDRNLILHRLPKLGEGNLIGTIENLSRQSEQVAQAFVDGYTMLRLLNDFGQQLFSLRNDRCGTIADMLDDIEGGYKDSIDEGDKRVEDYREIFVKNLKQDRKIPCTRQGWLPAGQANADEMIARRVYTEEEFQKADFGQNWRETIRRAPVNQPA